MVLKFKSVLALLTLGHDPEDLEKDPVVDFILHPPPKLYDPSVAYSWDQSSYIHAVTLTSQVDSADDQEALKKADLMKCRRYAFVHVPVTVSTSSAALWEEGFDGVNQTKSSALMRSLRYRPSDAYVADNALLHFSAADLRTRMTRDLGMRAWDDAYTFSVVRNPYDHVLSHFLYAAANMCRTRSELFGDLELAETDTACLAIRDANATAVDNLRDHRYVAAFHDWLRRMDATNFASLGLLTHVSEAEHKPPAQTSWLTDESDEKVLVDDVFLDGSPSLAELSTCEGLLTAVCRDKEAAKKECLESHGTPAANKEDVAAAAERAARQRMHQRREYYSTEARNIVRRVFAADFRRFDFQF